MDPLTILAALLNKFITVRDMTDLPDPDSPTTASISPRLKEKKYPARQAQLFLIRKIYSQIIYLNEWKQSFN
jgi:hypothetical protein